MGYTADGNGVIKFKNKVDALKLTKLLKDIDFDYYFDEWWYSDKDNALNVNVSCRNYHEPDKVLNQLITNFPVIDGETIEYVGEDKSYWRFRYSEKRRTWVEDAGEVTYLVKEIGYVNETEKYL